MKTTITLKKVYREVWQKKRGSVERVFSGHTTDYYINGVPIQKKDYTAQIAEITGDETIFKLLTSPCGFPGLHWQKQREILLEVCGNISDAEVIDMDPMNLAPLGPILQSRSIDDHRDLVKARRSEINKAMERIPIRIDEVKLGMSDITGLDKNTIEYTIRTLEQNLNDKKLRLQGVDTGGEIAQFSKELAIINSDIQRLEQEYYNDAAKTLNKINTKIMTLENTRRTRNLEKDDTTKEITAKQGSLEKYEAELEDLRGRWTTIDAMVFVYTQDTVCPTCNRPLPEEQLEAARKKALEEFNFNKAEKLKKIEEQGKVTTRSIESLKNAIIELNGKLLSYPEEDGNREYNELIEERNAAKEIAEDYAHVPGRKELLIKKTDLDEKMEKAKAGVSSDKIHIEGEIKVIGASLIEQKELLDKFAKRIAGEKRIEELRSEEKNLATEFERLERELYMLERFMQTKVKYLTERINEKFEFVHFKLFNVLVNGGFEDCCVVTVNGIPYDSGLNAAGRTQAGCDIIRTLQKHYGVAPVIWIDNRESCTLIPTKMDCQIISLYVSPQDETLRVEHGR